MFLDLCAQPKEHSKNAKRQRCNFVKMVGIAQVYGTANLILNIIRFGCLIVWHLVTVYTIYFFIILFRSHDNVAIMMCVDVMGSKIRFVNEQKYIYDKTYPEHHHENAKGNKHERESERAIERKNERAKE